MHSATVAPSLLPGTHAAEPSVKRPRIQPYFNRLDNAVSQATRKTLLEEAGLYEVENVKEHGTFESKCFFFSACVKWDRHLKPQLLKQPGVRNIPPCAEWNTIDRKVQQAALKMIETAGKQTAKLGFELVDKVRWVAFELIRTPLQGNVTIQELEWHCDPGYISKIEEPEGIFSDTTTIFMLTHPTWIGGHLLYKRDGVTDEIDYQFNEAVTFNNKGAEHLVTKIQSTPNCEDRIVFTCSIYDEEDTQAFMQHHRRKT